jgi:hypothetical protein
MPNALTPWEEIASLARLAPSPHNTQPFRIAPTDRERACIVLVPDRMLPREDHGNLYLASTYGVFTAAMRRAAAECGYELAVVPRDDVDVATLHASPTGVVLGHARVMRPCPPSHPMLLHTRRTSRLPYHPVSITSDTLEALDRTARRHGHALLVRSDAGFVADVLRLNANAIIDNLQIDDERQEIRAWSRFGPTPQFGDGLWNIPMNQPAWQLRGAFRTPRVLRWPGVRQLAIANYMRTQRGTRHVALLRGPFAQWSELILAGELLFDLWMDMAAASVYMHPMGSLLTNPTYAKQVGRAFGVTDGWLVFRLGYSDTPPASPRLESIILDHHTYQ